MKLGSLRWENSIYFRSSYPLVLWTLGTNWFDTKRNRKRISVAWKSFRKGLWRHYKKTGWFYPKFLVRAIEAGSIGNRLHIHFLSEVGVPHRWILRFWRLASQIPHPNVNYSLPMRCLPCYRDPDQEKYLSPDKSTKCKHCKNIFKKGNWDRIEGFYAFLYALKYCAKQSGSYYWQGHILKAKPPKPELVGYCAWKNCLLPLETVELMYNPFVVTI